MREKCGGDDEENAVPDHADDESPTSSSVVNRHDADPLGKECDDGVVCLVLQRVIASNPDKFEDFHGVVLDC